MSRFGGFTDVAVLDRIVPLAKTSNMPGHPMTVSVIRALARKMSMVIKTSVGEEAYTGGIGMASRGTATTLCSFPHPKLQPGSSIFNFRRKNSSVLIRVRGFRSAFLNTRVVVFVPDVFPASHA